jgi:protein-disulfide isomerase
MTETEAGPGRGAGRPRLLSGWKGAIAAVLAGAAIGAALVSLWSGPLFRYYLLEHPEIIPEAMQRLRARESALAVDTHRLALETPFAGAWAGAKDGDVVLVEFFDYACTYCRKSNPDVERLLREDPRLKVVWREWPVLGPDSEAAAQVSLAAARQGRFKPFHDRMFALGRPTAATIAQAQQALGIPTELVEQIRGSGAARTELGRNYELARALEATGTPTFVVGDQVLQGAVGYDSLKAAIAEARRRS